MSKNPVSLRFLSVLLRTVFALGLVATSFAADSTATIAGYVSNAASGNLLEGARVEIPQLGLVALTDRNGQFMFTDIPAGTHEVVASYIGLDNIKASVAVTGGQRVTRNFDLTTAIYQLDTFKVTGEREGNAAAMTAQRNATNLKNVVAIDAYGNLPNMNASELAILLPGVAPELSDEGNVVGFTIRGQGPGSNTITIDGALMASQGGAGRVTRMHTITGSMFDSLELTKGHTPDKGADSLGGTLNLKSRSPLSMKEKRRITYNMSARWAPPFTQQIPYREQHRMHPLLNVAYQEVFGVLGGDKNLGVAVNLFYSEQAVGFFTTTHDFQNTPNNPAYVWDFRLDDNYNNRKQSSINTKFDYRLSPNTKISLNLIYNDAFERFRLRFPFRAFTGNQNTVPSATSGVIPGFTDRITQVRPVAASTIEITTQMSNFFHRQRHASLGAEHEFGPLTLDYDGVISLDHINGGGGDGGVLVNRITGVGWILDRTQSDLYPRFIQAGGPDWSNPANYSPQPYNFADTFAAHEVRQLQGNARYKAPGAIPFFLKAGVRWREEEADNANKNRQYTFTGTNAGQLPTDPSIVPFGQHKVGLNVPRWNANMLARDRKPVDPSLWRENLYFHEMTKLSSTRGVTETVTAVYGMAQGNIGRTGFITGVRVEKTEDESWGWVRGRVQSTAAQQTADPVGSAQRDFVKREISGGYTKSFPSAHLTHDITRNLKARLSWSNSFGRPPLTNLMPNETANDTNQTLTISNPSLRPKTAETWDAALEYYFEPVGSLSVGWFHKSIKDYFVTNQQSGTVSSGADNGFNGEYAGYTILTTANLGDAIAQGWEISYQQQFTFLPGLLKGLGLSANYTYLTTHGNFGAGGTVRTNEVAGFIPRNGNISLSWRYRGFSSRINMNYTGDYLDTANAANPAFALYRTERKLINLGLAYQIRPQVSLSIDVGNLTNEVQAFYRGYSDRMQNTIIPGTTITFGVSGRF
jgi:iron complex outermembrane recepter protein